MLIQIKKDIELLQNHLGDKVYWFVDTTMMELEQYNSSKYCVFFLKKISRTIRKFEKLV